ncbi:hypothetical protein M0R04_09525 [Candidatus Dojkabacteria bacterium]|jgi:hypothetical protein|nr:hypothetical protein [Candidatus Dojkabacteria bacterium]
MNDIIKKDSELTPEEYQLKCDMAAENIIEIAGDMTIPFREKIEKIEFILFYFDQVQIPVKHTFCDGVYVREITIKKGTLLTNLYHKTETIDLMINGNISIVTPDGLKNLQGFNTLVAMPGTKRIGFALEDTQWVTVHKYTGKVPETDEELNKLEDDLFTNNYSYFNIVDAEVKEDIWQ